MIDSDIFFINEPNHQFHIQATKNILFLLLQIFYQEVYSHNSIENSVFPIPTPCLRAKRFILSRHNIIDFGQVCPKSIAFCR